MVTIVLVALLMFSHGSVYGGPGSETTTDKYVPTVSYVLDPEGRHTVSDMAGLADTFRPWDRPVFYHGYSRDTVWLRIHPLPAAKPGEQTYLLMVENPRLDDVRLFIETANEIRAEPAGDRLPFSARSVEHQNFVFQLPADLAAVRATYLRVQTTGPILVPLVVLTEGALSRMDSVHNLFHGAYYAAMIVLFSYNLILFFSLRDISFLYYVLFQVVISLLLATLTGFAERFLWPDSVWLNQHATIILVGLAAVLGSRVAASFLNLQARDRWIRYALTALLLTGLLGTLLALSPYLEFAHIFSQYATIFSLLIFIVPPLVLSFRPDSRATRYFLFAWMFFVAGAFLFIGRNLGLLPDTLLTRHGMHLGSVLEGIMLSVALGNRYNAMHYAALLSRLELNRLQEMDELRSRFYADVSHEFRTPLTLILSPVERLLRETPAGERQRMLTTIQRNALVLLRLFQNLLDLNRMDSGTMQPEWRRFDLAAFIRNAVEDFRIAAQERGLNLEFSSSPEPVHIIADPYLLERVLHNLLSNALRFTTQGHIRLRVSSGTDHADIEIEDTGRGIDPDNLPRIFDRFFGTSGIGPGSGLGLSLARDIIQLHGGSIQAESQTGVGSCFTIRLPARRQEPAPEFQDFTGDFDELRRRRESMLVAGPGDAAYHAEQSHPPDSRSDESFLEYTILLLEDNAELRTYLCETLAEHFQVTASADGSEALDRARSERPDLIVADIMTPGLDGYELLARCRQDPALSSTPFVFLTARGAVEDRVRGLQYGADEYLVKPFQNDELIARVKAVLRRRRTTESEVRGRVYAAFHDHLGGRLTDMYLLFHRPETEVEAQATLDKLREEVRAVLTEFRDFLSDEDDRANFAGDFADALHVILLRRYARVGRVLNFHGDESVSARLRGSRSTALRAGLHAVAIELATNDLKYGTGPSEWKLGFLQADRLVLRMQSASQYEAGNERGHGRRNLHHTVAVLHGNVEESTKDGIYRFTMSVPILSQT